MAHDVVPDNSPLRDTFHTLHILPSISTANQIATLPLYTPSGPFLPVSFIPASRSAKLYAHLSHIHLLPPISEPTISPTIPARTPTARQRRSFSQSPSFGMTPYIIPSSKAISSFTEVAQNLATVPPPSPSPRRRGPRAPIMPTRQAAGLIPNGMSLPNRPHPRMLFPLHPLAPIPSFGPADAVADRMLSSLPLISTRLKEVPIDGILKRKVSQKSARKIPVGKSGGSKVGQENDYRSKVRSPEDPFRAPDGTFSSTGSSIPSPVPLASVETICPFTIEGSVIRPPKTGLSTGSSTSTGRQKRVLRDMTNHAGLG